MVMKTIQASKLGKMTSGDLGDPFKLGELTITPDTWRRERVNGIFPRKDVTDNENNKRWRVHTVSGEYDMQNLADQPEFLMFVNDEPVSLVSRIYQPVTNYEVLKVLHDVLVEQKIDVLKARQWKWGHSMKTVVEVEEVSINGDAHRVGYMVGNSMDKTGGIWAGSYLWRMICSNGMMGWKSRETNTRRHTNNASSVGDFRHVLDSLIAPTIHGKEQIIATLEGAKEEVATQDWLTKTAKRLNMRKWELEQLDKRLEFEYPLGTGYLKPNNEFNKEKAYTKWDFVIDATAIARINREGEVVGDKPKKVNMNRATFIEQEILDCIRG